MMLRLECWCLSFRLSCSALRCFRLWRLVWALIADRVVWIVPVAVWIVTTVPQMAVTLAPMPVNVALFAFSVLLT